ncbi:unnamed protein product, partial [Coregonus sp. 'balchen']
CLGIVTVSSEELLHRQKRVWIIETFKIEESRPGPYPYELGKVNFFDCLFDWLINYLIDSYRRYHMGLQLTFEARYESSNQAHTQLGVEVEVLDINDNPPIVSVTPTPPDNLEFFLEQSSKNGTIKFKGCLDHEKAEKYTILAEAKDRGEVVQLSSNCTVIINIVEGNNHLPVFTGQTGAGNIKEKDSSDVPVLQLQVSDQDTKGTEAWKAKYTIHGDKDQNFRITTDPETNEGVLFLEKPLDYEDGSLKNLSVSVENEVPYFSCKVKGRPATGLWNVVTTGGTYLTGITPPLLSTRMVEDVNDPPIFTHAVKTVMVEENVEVGHRPRQEPRQHLRPPLTGTGTLNIHLKDQNDNLPELEMATMDMCLSDEPSKVNITAYDLDGEPYSETLLLPAPRGRRYTVNLVKQNTVYAGHLELLLKVFDQQGQGALHNLSVTVCDCSGFLLLSLLLTCKRELKLIPTDENSEECQIKYNIEIPGTDCKVPTLITIQVDSQLGTKAAFQPIKMTSAVQRSASIRAPVCSEYFPSYQEQQQGQFQQGTSLRKGSIMSRSMMTKTRYSSWGENNCLNNSGPLMTLLNHRISILQVPGEELGDYAPHPYAEEGDLETDLQLDAISIPETPFDQDKLLYLGASFNTLASICNTPDPSAS